MRRHYATLIAVSAIWATVPVAVRHSALAAPVIAFGRMAGAAIVLGVLLAVRRQPVLVRLPSRALLAGAILGVHWLAIFAAYQRASVGTVILITYLAPVVIAAVAPRALGEHLDARGMVALGLGFAGLAMVAAPEVGGASTTGAALAVAAAVTFAALIVVSKPVAEEIGGLRLAFVELVVGAVVVAPAAVVADWSGPSDRFFCLGALAIVHTALGMALYFRSLAVVPATDVGTLGYLEPALAVLAAWLFLSEQPTIAMVGGGALILGAGTLVAARTNAARTNAARTNATRADTSPQEANRVPR